MDSNKNSDYIQCPKCAAVISAGPAICPSCGCVLDEEALEAKKAHTEQWVRMLTGCGCLLVGLAVFLFVLSKIFWPCIAPALLVAIVLMIWSRSSK